MYKEILISSWNINSIRKRKDNIKQWIQKEEPAIILLQETKTRESRKNEKLLVS